MLGCPPTYIHMLKQLHRDVKAYIIVNGSLSYKTYVQQLTIESNKESNKETLFCIYFAVLLMYTLEDCDTGIYFRFVAFCPE